MHSSVKDVVEEWTEKSHNIFENNKHIEFRNLHLQIVVVLIATKGPYNIFY
jgi:hypothetical protein